MDADRKSRLLSICFRSIFSLPQLDALEKHTSHLLEPPNIQVQCALKPRGLWQDTRLSLLCVARWGARAVRSTGRVEALGSCLKALAFACLGHGP